MKPVKTSPHPGNASKLLVIQGKTLLSLIQNTRIFFESSSSSLPKEMESLRETAKKTHINAQKDAEKNNDKSALYLSSCLYRIGEEIFLSVLETAEFKIPPSVEMILVTRHMESATHSILSALSKYPQEFCAPHLIMIKKFAADMAQINKKARYDAIRDARVVTGLKYAEILLRFAEAGELFHKIADAIGETLSIGKNGAT